MTISLPSQKLASWVKSVRQLADGTKTPLRDIAQVLGTIVAAHPAILPAPLYYRHMEWTKMFYFNHGCSYNDTVPISKDIQSDLRWWIQEASSYNGQPLQITQWDLTVESNASKQGWGASCQGTNTGGPWTASEQSEHTNLGSLSDLTIVLFKGNIYFSSPSNGQYYSNLLLEQVRRQPLTDFIRPGQKKFGHGASKRK